MLAATLHMMEGTPYIYQGEELGMTNIDFSSIHDYRDLDTLNAWHELVDQQHALTSEDMLKRIHRRSRDNARTPMQWDATQHAGFTKVPLDQGQSKLSDHQCSGCIGRS